MEEFKRIFSEITKDFEILSYDGKSSDSYTCKVQCLLHYDGQFDEKCASFVESFSKQTNSMNSESCLYVIFRKEIN